MEEDVAWEDFESTGKIDRYLKYIEIKKKKYNEEIGVIEGEISENIQSKRNSN